MSVLHDIICITHCTMIYCLDISYNIHTNIYLGVTWNDQLSDNTINVYCSGIVNAAGNNVTRTAVLSCCALIH